MSEISQEIRDIVQRRMAASAAFSERMITVADTLPEKAVREIVKLAFAELGYLGDHMPEERESVEPFACSGETYHYCSFSARHHERCKAVGGDGDVGDSPARSCEPDCGRTDAEPWCHCSGFDCGTCAIVDSLLGVLASAGHITPSHCIPAPRMLDRESP